VTLSLGHAASTPAAGTHRGCSDMPSMLLFMRLPDRRPVRWAREPRGHNPSAFDFSTHLCAGMVCPTAHSNSPRWPSTPRRNFRLTSTRSHVRLSVRQNTRHVSDEDSTGLVLTTLLRLVASGSIWLRFLRKTPGPFASDPVWFRLAAGVCAQECAQGFVPHGSLGPERAFNSSKRFWTMISSLAWSPSRNRIITNR